MWRAWSLKLQRIPSKILPWPIITEVYSRTGYECYSAFDPDFECTAEEEKKLVRKLDWCVAFTACLMFVGSQIDRGNLAQLFLLAFLPQRSPLR